MTDDDEPELWTESAREAFRASRDALVAAILEESNAILAATSESEDDLDRSTDAVYAAGVRYSESHYELTGFYGIAGVWDDDEADDEGPDSGEEDHPTETVSVVQRSDYVIEDTEAVLAAARAAWLKSYPDASDVQLTAHVGHLGGALYSIGHEAGWEHLERVEGIRPLGAIAKVIAVTDHDSSWLDAVDWEDSGSGFTVAGEVIYSEADHW